MDELQNVNDEFQSSTEGTKPSIDASGATINRGTIINIPIHQFLSPETRTSPESDSSKPKLSVTTPANPGEGTSDRPLATANQFLSSILNDALPPHSNIANPSTNGGPSNQNYVGSPGNNNLAAPHTTPSPPPSTQTHPPNQQSQENRFPSNPAPSSDSPNGQVSNYVLSQDPSSLSPPQSTIQPQSPLPIVAQNYGGLVSNIVLTQAINADGSRFPLKSLAEHPPNQPSTDSRNQLSATKRAADTKAGSS